MTVVRRALTGAWKLLLFLVRLEIGIWRSLFRWATGRHPGAGPGTTPYAYAGQVLPIIWAFIGVSVVEVVAVHLVLARWPTIQIGVLVLGIWGLLWMVGLLASIKIHPHLVTPEGLRVRNASALDLPLDWEAIDAIVMKRGEVVRDRRVVIEETPAGTVLKAGQLKQTNVVVRLVRPLDVRLSQGDHSLVEVHLYADEPRVLVAAVRRGLAQRAGAR